MSRKEQRVDYTLDPKGIKDLPFTDIKAILRGADELIATGGRSLLAKILKGSRDKKLLQYGLDLNPVYGFYKELKVEDITARIDWLIKKGYLDIEYRGRLPVIIYTERGWEIERDAYSDELLETSGGGSEETRTADEVAGEEDRRHCRTADKRGDDRR